jgi:Fe2+ or Zn2+ uptake regulation protein
LRHSLRYCLTEKGECMDEAAIFERYLRSHGYNATSDRKAIAGLVFSLHEHFTAEDLVTKLKARR